MSKIRFSHKLKRNAQTYIPTQFIFFDTETKQIKRSKVSAIHKLKLGWACYWRRETKSTPEILKYEPFKKPSEFWNFVESNTRSKTRLVIMAHNIVFDYTIVDGWTELVNRGWKLTRLYEKNHVFIAKYKKGSRSILLLDNMNFFISSLAVLGKQIDYEKLNVDFDKCTFDQLSVYCKRDVEILVKTWQQYFAWFMANDLGNFGVTISSQAFNTYRHRFMPQDIFIHNRKYALNLERESYFGGRTECFKLGDFTGEKFYYLDVNSMYPAVMKSNWYPVKYLRYDLKCTPAVLKYYLNKYCIVARVKIDTKKPIVPLRRKEKVIFPIGKFETILTTGELSLALKENVITKVLSVAIYQRGKIFKAFVAFFYNERIKAKSQGKTAYDVFYKILMNSLYGKFGQQMGEWETVDHCDPKQVDYWNEIVSGDSKIYRYRKINGLVQRYENKSEAFNSFPAISAHVTAYARVKMWGLISKAGVDNIYYCDTDSLFVNQQGYDNLLPKISKTDLGKLKLEDVTEDLKLFGCKHYIFGKYEKHKGRKKSAVKIDRKTYAQDQWGTLKSLIRNKNLCDYEVRQVIKKFTGIYDKGLVCQNGDVKPLVL